MALLEAVSKQAIVLRSYAAFGALADAERYRAMSAMAGCGSAGVWCLQLALRQTGQPRVQFAACVVLHWLGDRQGITTLTEALKWRLPSEPLLAPQLDSAFIAIGSPDAVSALLTVWNMLPDWGDHELVRDCIGRVWAALRNPVVLPALAAGAAQGPARFENTVPPFGEMAIPVLRDMTRAPDAQRRRIAVQTLRHIPGQSAFSALLPLLQDSEPAVRALVPAALEVTGNRDVAVAEISRAVRSGYPSVHAIDVLSRARPGDLYDTLTEMIESWRPERPDSTDSQIVLLALPPLLACPGVEHRVVTGLCALLERPFEPRVSVALIQAIESLSVRAPRVRQACIECILVQFTHSNASIRQQAASTLARFGDTFPERVTELLEHCRPQDGFFAQLQSILRGGSDASQAATQAVQQVSQWWNRLTSDAAVGSRGGAAHIQIGAGTTAADSRLPAILRLMLARAIEAPLHPRTQEQVEERAAFMSLVLRALSRLGLPVEQCPWEEIVAVLYLPADAFAPAGLPADLKCYETATAAAAEALMAMYGAGSFALFLEALYSPRVETVRTAISALGVLGDRRSLTHLAAIAGNERHPCAAIAEQAIGQIRRTNPEMMTLLRGSSQVVAESSSLLRAARGRPGPEPSDLLLRPIADQSD